MRFSSHQGEAMANEDRNLEQTVEAERATSAMSKKKHNWPRTILVIALFLVVAGLGLYKIAPLFQVAHGFFWFTTASESHEERYGDIDRLLDRLEYSELGSVIDEGYDGSSHPLDPASFEATIRSSNEKFNELKSKIEAIDLPGDCSVTETSIACSDGSPAIVASKDRNEIITLTVRD